MTMLGWHPTHEMTFETVLRGVLFVLYVYGGEYERDLSSAGGGGA